jgi:hypothetical protein
MVDWLADLELAIRHVAEGELKVARQRELVAWLERGGHPTDQAEKLLKLLETILREMISHKEFIEAEVRREGLAALHKAEANAEK